MGDYLRAELAHEVAAEGSAGMRVVLGFELPGEVVEGGGELGAAQAGRPLRQTRPVRHPADGETEAARVDHGGEYLIPGWKFNNKSPCMVR